MIRYSITIFVMTLLFSSAATAQDLRSARELYASGNWETAKEAYTDLYQAEDSNVRVEASLGMAGILWEQGKYTQAMKWVKTTKELISKTKRNDLVARRLFTEGNLHAAMGHFGKASTTLRACELAAKRYKDTSFEVLCRMGRRFVRELQGKSMSPRRAYLKDLGKLKATGDPILVGTALVKNAALRDKAGRYGDAIQLLQLAEVQFKKANSDPAIARNRLRIAAVYQNAGQWEKAAKSLDGLVSLFRNMSNKPALIGAYSLLGRQAQQAGDSEDAIRYFSKAKAAASGVSSPQIRAQVELGFCEYHAQKNDLKKAISHCEKAYRSFVKLGLSGLAARSKIKLAGVAQKNGNRKLAADSYDNALGLLRKMKTTPTAKREIAFLKTNLCQVLWEDKAKGAAKACASAVQSFGGLKKDSIVYDAMARAHYMRASSITSLKTRKRAFLDAGRLFQKANEPIRAADAYLRAAQMMKPKKAIGVLNKAISWIDGNTEPLGVEVRDNILTHLAENYLESANWTDAMRVLERLREYDIHAEKWAKLAWVENARARALLKLKKRDRALIALEKCVSAAKKAKDVSQGELCKENLKKLQK